MSASREQLQAVLNEEARRWEAKSWEELTALEDAVCYELPGGFQVEVNVLERTAKYVHVGIGIDDGSLRRFFSPLSTSVIVTRA